MNLESALKVFLNAGNDRHERLKSDLREAEVYLVSEYYSQEDKDNVIAHIKNQIQELEGAWDIMTNLSNIVKRYNWAKNNMEMHQSEVMSMLTE